MDHVYCAECGAELAEGRSLQPEQRAPCPTCGSMARRFAIELGGALELNSALPITPNPSRTVRNVGIDAIIEAPTATATAEALPPTVEVQASDEAALEEDSEVVEQARAVTDELVVQGFILSWTELTASPVAWMAQVFDGSGDEIATGVGDDPLEILAGLADRLLPHHPG